MALLDIFKKKKPASVPPSAELRRGEEKKEKKAPAVKVAKKPASAKATAGKGKREKIEPMAIPKKKIPASAYGILQSPHVTEKATDFSEKNKYIFKVQDRANKAEIKRAVENNYGVDVVKVNIINIKGKERMMGRQRGWKKGYKKAIVKIKEGQKIEVLPR